MTYASYKLALDLIVWKTLELNEKTRVFANGYLDVMRNATDIMSQLQRSDGCVRTSYTIDNRTLVVSNSLSSENGETNSLFVLAS